MYVLKVGQVVEQGYRYDFKVVDRKEGGIGEMMEVQRRQVGFSQRKIGRVRAGWMSFRMHWTRRARRSGLDVSKTI